MGNCQLPNKEGVKVVKSIKLTTENMIDLETGEIVTKDFREIIQSKRLKGGFYMAYKSYDAALLEVVSSKLDLEMVTYIRTMFTYDKVEVGISGSYVAKEIGTSKQNVTGMLKKLVVQGLLTRVRRGVYRLNPFMFVPYRSDAELLQREWKELAEDS